MSTSIFVGHAKPPATTVSGQMHTIHLAKEYLNRLLSGRNLSGDEDAIVAELEGCYFSGTQKSLIQCCGDIGKRYRARAGTAPPDVSAG